MYIYPDIDITFFVITNTNDVIYQDANFQFLNNLENLIDSSSLFFAKFTINIQVIIIITIPLICLIVTMGRKIKRRKYTLFIGVSGKIIFSVDVLVLIILPLILLIVCYATDPSLKYTTIFNRDITFIIIIVTLTLILNFIIKLVYLLLYKNSLISHEGKINKKVEQIEYKLDEDE